MQMVIEQNIQKKKIKMSKRFTDTNKWEDSWFRELSPKSKCFWFYITDKCDNAGVWKPDLKLASFIIGEPIESEQILKETNAGKERIKILETGEWHILDFVKFQFGQLKKNSPLYKNVVKLLEFRGMAGVYQGYGRGIDTPVVKVKVKEKVRVMVLEKEKTLCNEFDQFWKAYPKKEGKGKALEEWLKAGVSLEVVLKAVEAQKKWPKWQKDGGQYIPMPATWLHQKRWQDEGTEVVNGTIPTGIRPVPGKYEFLSRKSNETDEQYRERRTKLLTMQKATSRESIQN